MSPQEELELKTKRKSNDAIKALLATRILPMSDSTLKLFVDLATLAVLLFTLFAALWQVKLIRRTLEADTFVEIQERAEQIKLSETVDLINSWALSDYATYQRTASPAEQIQVRALVDFLNDLSHLARDRYIDDYYPIRLYSPALLTCREKLLPWWVEGLRTVRSNEYLYNNFVFLCDYAQYWKDRRYKKVGYRKYLRKRGVVEL
jgi:hypothetical protein